MWAGWWGRYTICYFFWALVTHTGPDEFQIGVFCLSDSSHILFLASRDESDCSWKTTKTVKIPQPYACVIHTSAWWLTRVQSPLHVSGMFLAKGTRPTTIHLSGRGSNINEKLSTSSSSHFLCTCPLLPAIRDAGE